MNKVLRNLSLIGLSAFSLTALSGCETGEDRTLASAQSCLDGAHTEADANQCIAIVEGLRTAPAYLIRCSANFIAQGFTGDRIADAFQGMQENDGGADPMLGLMAYLNFQNSNPLHSAEETVNNCNLSGKQSMLRLATAAQLSTTLSGLAGIGFPIDPSSPDAAEEMEDAVQSILDNLQDGDSSNDPDLSILGTVATTAAGAFCNTGSAYANEEVCINLNAALAAPGGTPASIGQELIDQLLANSGH